VPSFPFVRAALWVSLALSVDAAAAPVPGPAPAQAPYLFAAAPGHLPKNVVPLDYRIAIVPDVAKRTLHGTGSIDLRFDEATDTIQFNALNMRFADVRLDGKPVKKVSIDAKRQIVTVTLAAKARPGRHVLNLAYDAQIESGPRGLFAQPFQKPGGSRDILLSTQFEATDARRMFPCWDEPAFRARFELTATIPAAWAAISNMPVKRRVVHGDLATTTFERSPSMSSYLVEFTGGDMASIGTRAGDTAIKVWAVRGQEQNGKQALEDARTILLDYNDYFGVAFPLPKLDAIAVPGGFQGAMENWGAITYNDQTLLLTPASTLDNRQLVFSISAHEMAHQWFGDLVTMGWWDDIWLNESFASWAAARETDKRNPDWRVREAEDAGKEAAMRVDARLASRAVHYPVENELEPQNNADPLIIYNKGQAVLRMFEAYLGADRFREGIRAYMKTRQYSNATSTDLWNALGSASGQDVGRLARDWIEQPGFPLVAARAECDAAGARTLTLTQSRFLLQGEAPVQPRWAVPLRMRVGGSAPQSVLLEQDGQRVAAGNCDQPLSLNADADGFFRVAYDDALLTLATRQFAALPDGDRIALLDDQWALVESGKQTLDRYLALAQAMGDRPNERAWNQILGALDTIERAERGTPGHAAFVAWARNLVKPVAARMSDASGAAQTAGLQRLRRNLVAHLGAWDDPDTVADARRRFAAFVADRASLAPDEQAAVLTVVAQHADAATFEQLHAIARAAKNETEVRRYYPILMRVRDPQLAQQAAAIALSPEIPPQADVLRLGLVLTLAGEHPQLAWDTFTGQLDRLTAANPGNRPNVLAKNVPEVFWAGVPAATLQGWVKDHIDAGMADTLADSMQTVRFRQDEKARLVKAADRIAARRP
jgi:aminopeptidase N